MTELFVHIKSGVISNPKAVRKAFTLKDGAYKVTIKRANKRSLPLNRYYWGCVLDIEQKGFEDIGYDYSKERVHEFNKVEFNYEEIINHNTGEIKKVPLSSADLTNTQFMEFIERIKQFSAEWLGAIIPDPNTQMALNYE